MRPHIESHLDRLMSLSLSCDACIDRKKGMKYKCNTRSEKLVGIKKEKV